MHLLPFPTLLSLRSITISDMAKPQRNLLCVLCAVVVIAMGTVVWVLWANTAPVRTDYTVASTRLPQEFDGFRIAQISDLHNAQMGENNSQLLDMLSKADPDIIVITGDLIDANRTDTGIALAFMQEAVRIAPCYFVTGNHESAISRADFFDFQDAMQAIGVTVLHNEAVTLERGGASITLLGVDDPNYEGMLYSPEELRALATTDGFTVLLSHRPEEFERYAAAGMDVVFSGHAHGGQFRLPLLGGLYAPGQGVLPEYDCGVYTYGNTNMVVSRGIGNSSFPLRINNRPELVVVTLTGRQE